MAGEITVEQYPNNQIVVFFKSKEFPSLMIQMCREDAEKMFDALANTLGYKDTNRPMFKHQLNHQQSRLNKAESVCRAFERWYFHTNAPNWEELKRALKLWSEAQENEYEE